MRSIVMVEKEEFEGQEAYRCEACGFHYSERETAERCEEFCETREGCSTEITAKAVERR